MFQSCNAHDIIRLKLKSYNLKNTQTLSLPHSLSPHTLVHLGYSRTPEATANYSAANFTIQPRKTPPGGANLITLPATGGKTGKESLKRVEKNLAAKIYSQDFFFFSQLLSISLSACMSVSDTWGTWVIEVNYMKQNNANRRKLTLGEGEGARGREKEAWCSGSEELMGRVTQGGAGVTGKQGGIGQCSS